MPALWGWVRVLIGMAVSIKHLYRFLPLVLIEAGSRTVLLHCVQPLLDLDAGHSYTGDCEGWRNGMEGSGLPASSS